MNRGIKNKNQSNDADGKLLDESVKLINNFDEYVRFTSVGNGARVMCTHYVTHGTVGHKLTPLCPGAFPK